MRIRMLDAHSEADRLNLLSHRVIGAALRVHRELGPELLESAYETCLTFELVDAGFKVERQVPVPLVYRGRRLDCGYRTDLIVESALIVEVKAIERLEPVHTAQVLSHLKLSGKKIALLINFHVKRLEDGVRRLVNDFPE